ncbi:MAG: ribose-phosphate diphosphokinase [Thermoprotei archaeon]|nr:MAG: ribose-phosphate diphosphokinase [Thermoprotei archaeon]
MIIVGGPASNNIDLEIARIMNIPQITLEYKTFPDGESYIRYPVEKVKLSKETVVIVQSLYPPQDKHFLELLLAISTAKDLGAEEVVAVVPYLAYARQDKRFRAGEAISVNVILKSIEFAGADRFITIDIHKEESLKVLSIPYKNLTAMKELAKYLAERNYENPVILAPDRGAISLAKDIANILNTEYDYIIKVRDKITGEVRAEAKTLDIKDKTVIIVDDIISTGGTMALAARCSLASGAKTVVAVCTHALLVGNALDRLRESGVSDIIATNSVPSPVSKVSVASVVAEYLQSII